MRHTIRRRKVGWTSWGYAEGEWWLSIFPKTGGRPIVHLAFNIQTGGW